MIETKVLGMTCQGCVKSVTNALKSLDANAEVTVELATKLVTVKTNKNASDVKATIEDAGYDVESIKNA